MKIYCYDLFALITGQALVESGEAYKQMADIKYALEDNVKQNFIEPLRHLQSKDLKEVNVSHRYGQIQQL